jgi:hypothetical protein
MTNSKQKRIVVVLGMHRSGTSAITRSLGLLGIDLGDNLHPPGFDNPKGFWEDKDCLEINEQLLGYYGSAYDKLGFAWRDFDTDPFISALKLKAAQIISSRIAAYDGKWGFKDPRTCRFIRFWRSVFEICKCDVYFIIALRNPLSVALSLEARNRIPIEKGYLLWLQHMLPAVLDSIGVPRLVVDYDLLMESPFLQVARISSMLGLSIIDENSLNFQDYANNFLEKGLRHATSSIADLQCDHRVPPDVITAYQLLLRAAKDDLPLNDESFLNFFQELNARLNAFSAVFSYINAREDETLALYSEIANLKYAVGERDSQIAGLTHELAAYRVQADEFARQIVGLQGELAAAQTHITHQTKELAAYRTQADEFAHQIAGLQGKLTSDQLHITHKLRLLAAKLSQFIQGNR